MLRVLCIVAILTAGVVKDVRGSDFGHFNGGSVSFSVHKNDSTGTFFVDLDVITGWVLGKGPCGLNCSKSDIGMSTSDRRLEMQNAKGDQLYFGNWTAEYHSNMMTMTTDLNPMIQSNMKETIIAMNKNAEWEQELMKVSVELETTNTAATEDIYFEGDTWHPLTMQPEYLSWHIQAKIDKQIRNDTGQPNQSPIVFVKPFYRIKLNKVSTIRIAATDPDGDKVRCKIAEWSEGGKLTKHPLPGLNITEDCEVIIDASTANNYTGDSWGVVALSVADYNQKEIELGDKPFQPFLFHLSSTAAQFLIQILEHLNAPTFVKPTAPGNHHFILYAGTVWRQKIYAKSNENTTIEEFIVMGRQGEDLQQSAIMDGDEDHVRYIEIKWVPDDDEIGNRLICITAIDNTGVDSDEDRCFSVEIKPDRFNHSSAPVSNRPYFIDLPAFEQVVECKKDVTCILPLYVMSKVEVKTVRYTSTFFEVTETGPVLNMSHDGHRVYESDLTFRDSADGLKKICVQAIDVQGVKSMETCIQSKLTPPDPCGSNPCRNSAKCIRSEKDDAAYACICISDKFTGKNCDKMAGACDPSPCVTGKCYTIPPAHFYCDCQYNGFSGTLCSFKNDKCAMVSCNGHGICNDGTCECFDRYDGTNCQQEVCQPAPQNNLTCDYPNCSSNQCNGHGICQPDGSCVCSIGYKTQKCMTASGDASKTITGTKFIPPSPQKASVIFCYLNQTCEFSVYFTTTESSTPTIKFDRTTAALIPVSRLSAVTEVNFIEGIDKLHSARVSIDGDIIPGKKYMCLLAKAGSSDDRLCLEILHIVNPLENTQSMEYNQKDAVYKFIDPTPNGDSSFVSYVNDERTLLLNTNLVGGQCEKVVSSENSVTVHSTKINGSSCITEAGYTFHSEGTKHICFVASIKPKSEKRCFSIEVYTHSSDKCAALPCQHDGECFHNKRTDYTCFCKPGYKGDRCEKGKCDQADNHCSTEAACYADDHKAECICPIGMTGKLCNASTSDKVSTSAFTDTAVPLKVTCVKNRLCTIPLGVSTNSAKSSVIEFGYVSPHIRKESISKESTLTPETIRATVSITPLEVGEKTVCVQTQVDRSNEDEICISVHVTEDFSSIYGFQDRPSFIAPSLPTDTVVRCPVDEPCHVLYHVAPGKGHEKECTTVIFTKTPFKISHAFSKCISCNDGDVSNNNCSIDVSVVAPNTYIGNKTTVCVTVELTTTQFKGEERCFTVTVQAKADFTAKKGCQQKKCNNGGFCDSHVNPAVCFCPAGFTGPNCENPVSGTQNATSGSFISNFAVPTNTKCTVNQTCRVNFHITGPPNSKPNVSLGYVDPNLDVTGRPILHTGTNGYTGTISIKPTHTGESKLCVQAENTGKVDDELCMAIDVGVTPGPDVDRTNPYFVDPPTLTPGSTILCKAGETCYMELYSPPGARFGSNSDCPNVEDTSPNVIAGMHIFVPKIENRMCRTSVAYITAIQDVGKTFKLCTQVVLPGKLGEERCFNIQIVNSVETTVTSPCRGKTCQHNGKCIANLDSTPIPACICRKGFDGPDCNTSIPSTPTDLPGVSSPLPPTPPGKTKPTFDGESAIPKEITCIQGEDCQIPFPYKGTKPPVFGYVDPNLTTDKPVILPGGGNTVTTNVVSNSTGTHKLCLQTTVDGGPDSVNVDEVCVQIKIAPGPKSTVDQSKGYFVNGNFLDNSTATCKPSANCHIPIYTKPSSPTGKCPKVKECPPGVTGIHVFESTNNNGVCVTDAAYKTGASETNETICISAGPNGEERHLGIEVKSMSKFGPCQEQHCQHGGKCVANLEITPAVATCICAQGFEGPNCETAVDKTKDLPGTTAVLNQTTNTPHIDGKAAIPDEIICVTGETCSIPIPVRGTKPPVFGFVDPHLSYEKPIHIKGGTAITKVSSNTTGTHTVCVQTTLDGKADGINVDEVCVKVKVAPGPSVKPDSKIPHFSEETATDNSSVLCDTNTNCRIPVFTKPPQGGHCAAVKECPPGLTGVHVFQTREDNGTCITDAVYKTGNVAKTETICIKAGPGGEERHLGISTQPFSKFGPCQEKHCKHGGKCIADLNPILPTTECFCPSGYEGPTCEPEPTTPKNLPGIKGNPNVTSNTNYVDGKSAIPTEIVCVKGEVCQIPLAFKGSHPPTLGYVDPNLTCEKPTNVSKGHSTTRVSSNTTGSHTICLQTTTDGTADSENVDEVCVQVRITPDMLDCFPYKHDQYFCDHNTTSGQFTAVAQNARAGRAVLPQGASMQRTLYTGPAVKPDEKKPHFSGETATENSKVQCDTNIYCHLPVYTKPTGAAGECPDVKQCVPGVTGVHAFETKKEGGFCVTDVVYKTGASPKQETVCISSGLDGEKRHLGIEVKPFSSTKFGPCQETHCKNGGKCLADLVGVPKKSVCACKTGFEGNACESVITKPKVLPGMSGVNVTTTTPRFDGNAALPKEIICVQGEECQIPIPYSGFKPPTIGFVDPRLHHGKPQVIPGGNSVTKVSSNATGTYKICLQTTVDGNPDSENVDEVCTQVTINPGPSAKPNQNKPHFSGETATEKSTVLCDTDTSCRLPVYTVPTSPRHCEDVKECPPGMSGVHAFKTTFISGRCVTDVVYRTGSVSKTETVCISAGPDGEEKHIDVEVKHPTGFGPCQTVHCKNKGKCVADLTVDNGTCVCPYDYSGDHCDKAANTSRTLPGVPLGVITTVNTPYFDGTAAIPKEIQCVKDKPCQIPIPYHGTKPPIVGFANPKLHHSKPTLLPDGNALVKVTANETGTHRLCLQTTLNGTAESPNVDEICIQVKVSGAPSTTPGATGQHFEGGTIPEKSTVSCNTNTNCHIPFYTKPVSGNCSDVKECPPALQGTHVFETKLVNGTCVAEVVHKTGSTDKTEDLCISAGPDGEQRHIKVEVKKFTDFGPCQKRQCENGGTCIANTTGSAQCVCPTFVSGTTCDVVSKCKDYKCYNGGVCREVQQPPTIYKADCVCPNGYEGNQCGKNATSHVNNLPGVSPGGHLITPQTPRFDGMSVIPKEVICIANTPCKIPVHYNGPSDKPPVLGHVSPSLNASKPVALTVPGGRTTGPHIAVTTVIPTAGGPHKICFQTTIDGNETGENVDEICSTVKITTVPATSPVSGKPHFEPSTLSSGSTVTCDANIKCHFPIVTEKSANANCSATGQCSPKLPDAFVLPTREEGGKCVTDIVVETTTPITQTLCVSAGPGGEERHYNLETLKYKAFGPCQKLHCKNGGKCDSGNGTAVCNCPLWVTGTECEYVSPCKSVTCKNGGVCSEDKSTPGAPKADCVCPSGYEGQDCSTESTVPMQPLPGVTPGTTGTMQTPYFDGQSTIPKEIICQMNKPCSVPLHYTGYTGKPPILGHVSPGLNATEPITMPVTGGKEPGSRTAVATIVPTSGGQQKLCVQTTVDGEKTGENIDEICTTITVKSGPVASPIPGKPNFDKESPTDGSTVLCNTDIKCHMPVVTEKPGTGNCSTVEQCTPQLPNSVILPTKEVNGKCVTDIVIKTGHAPTPLSLCVSAGPSGEKRHYKINTENYTEFGPCQKVHCQSGGKCDSGNGTAVCQCPAYVSGSNCEVTSVCQGVNCSDGQCVEQSSGSSLTPMCACKPGFTGDDCKIRSGQPSTLPGVVKPPALQPDTARFDGTSAIPKEVKCFVNKPCKLPLQYFGHENKPPILGTVDPDLNASKPHALPGGTNPGPHTIVTTVTPTSIGNKQLCFQTTVDGRENGVNIDEICMQVTIQPQGPLVPTPDPTMPHFESTDGRNLPDGSKLTCPPDTSCHVPVVTEPNAQGKCLAVAPCKPKLLGLSVFKTTIENGACVTDISYRTGHTETNHTICLVAGPGGEKRHYPVEIRNTTEYGPCQKLHCEKGGKCVSQSGTPYCKCRSLMSGKTCHDVSPCLGKTCNNGQCVVLYNGSTGHSACACQKGYEGDSCNTTSGNPTQLTGVSNNPPQPGPQTPHINGKTAIPKTIVCYATTTCSIPIPFHGYSTKPPTLGHIDPGINAKPPTSTPGPNPGHHTAFTEVIAKTPGVHRVCIQTTVTGLKDGGNIDEVCVNVTVKDHSAAPPAPDPRKPHFHPSQVPGESTFTCKLDTSCHIDVLTKPSVNGQCPQVEECGAVDGVKVFSTAKLPSGVKLSDGNVDYDVCVTDVTVRTGSLPKTDTLCLSSGSGGEQRQIKIQTKDTKEYGPCQKVHCKNGGNCDAVSSTTAICCCPSSHTGVECEGATNATDNGQNVCPDPTRSTNSAICDVPEERKHARKMVKSGLVSCVCQVNGKRTEIIKRTPAPATSQVAMMAAYGAGGSTGLMALAAIAYIIVTKAKKPRVHPRPAQRPARQ